MCKVDFSLREYDGLDGYSNFVPWKIKVQILMEEVDLWEHVEKKIVEPTNATQLATHWKKEAKVKKIILDCVKDHFISYV